jgi:hypothetical protein
MRHRAIAPSLCLLLCSLVLTACSTSFAPPPETAVDTAFGNIAGYSYGGQQPITGATVTAYQTSTTAYGGASTPLATTTTDSDGYFTFPASTTCTSGTVVYLYSLGGDPTPGIPNPAAGEMVVLGVCPASGLLINAITTSTSAKVYMNEVSTVAAAYALAGFAETSANVPTDATHIGALTTTNGVVTDTLAQTGIQNAGRNAAQLYTNVDTGTASIGSTRAALATTPNGNGTVPQTTLDTLANVLAACINSTGPTSNACSSNSSTRGLFYYATSNGATTGTVATDTATAALNIAHNPAANVTALYNLVGSTTNPFTPALTAAPASFIVELLYTGGGLAASCGDAPRSVAVDGSGNVWTAACNVYANQFSPLPVLVKLSPQGVPASSTGYGGNGLNEPTSVTIDAASAYVWAANYNGQAVSRFTTAGVAASSFNIGFSYAQDVEFDGAGNAWVPVCTSTSELVKLSSSGSLLLTLTGNGMDCPDPGAIMPGAAGNIWIPNQGGTGTSVFTNAGAVASGSPASSAASMATAIDAAGNVWNSIWYNPVIGVAPGAGSTAVPLYGPSQTTTCSSGNPAADGLAIDGAGNLWVSSTCEKSVFEGSNASVLLGNFPALASGQPDGLALDGSGNVWYNDATDANLHELLGASIPVVTPIAYGVANNLLGTRP